METETSNLFMALAFVWSENSWKLNFNNKWGITVEVGRTG